MRVYFLLSLLPFYLFAQDKKAVPTISTSHSVQQAITADAPGFKFVEETWDFKDIPQSTPVTHIYEFENTGKDPIIISQVTASCGCTTPEWTKEPVMAGKKGTVKVTYNAAKEGTFTKTVTILSNVGNPKYLTIKGNVLSRSAAPDAPNQEK